MYIRCPFGWGTVYIEVVEVITTLEAFSITGDMINTNMLTVNTQSNEVMEASKLVTSPAVHVHACMVSCYSHNALSDTSKRVTMIHTKFSGM